MQSSQCDMFSYLKYFVLEMSPLFTEEYVRVIEETSIIQNNLITTEI